MKAGKTLVELAQELQRQQESKRDFIADTRELVLHQPGPGNPVYSLGVNGHGRFAVTDHTHHQIAQRLGIPQKYYDRMMAEAPGLLRSNVNHWFREKPERRMVRTLDGNARAFLSDRYRPLDNFDLAEAVLPVLQEANGIKIESCEITERRMYIKALFPRIEAEVKRGDVVQSGIVITNSEIGLGALKIEPLVFRLVCLNGMIAADYSQKKYHVGRAADEGEAAFELYRDETLRQDDRAFWLKVQDTVRAFAVDHARFEKVVEKMRDATERKLADPLHAVEVVTQKYQLNEGEKTGVLRHLIEGGDLSQFGLVNAITRAAQDVESYDRSTDMERLGGTVLELPRSEWEVLAKTA
jgi:hypothetical protein